MLGLAGGWLPFFRRLFLLSLVPSLFSPYLSSPPASVFLSVCLSSRPLGAGRSALAVSRPTDGPACPVLSCPVLSCPVLLCRVLSCPVLYIRRRRAVVPSGVPAVSFKAFGCCVGAAVPPPWPPESTRRLRLRIALPPAVQRSLGPPRLSLVSFHVGLAPRRQTLPYPFFNSRVSEVSTATLWATPPPARCASIGRRA